MDTLRIGFVGAGDNTRRMHIPGFQALPGVELVTVANRSEASSRAVAEACGIARISPDWESVVHDPEVDAICIGTWPYLHAEITIAALEQGKHVLCEARMAMNVMEARLMLSTAQARPEQVAQLVPAPFSLAYDNTIRDWIAAGNLGDIREVCVTHTSSAYARSEAPFSWRQDVALSGINTLTLGIYHEMVQRWIQEEPVFVQADGTVFTSWRGNGTPQMASVKIPESVSVLGRYNSGARLIYHFSGVESGVARNEVRINGSEGSLHVDLAQEKLFYYEAGQQKGQELSYPAKAQNGWQVEADFVASIRDGKPVTRTSFSQGLRYMQFTEAVIRSMRSRGNRLSPESL